MADSPAPKTAPDPRSLSVCRTHLVERLEAQGFLARAGDRLRVREAGALLLDAILPQVVAG